MLLDSMNLFREEDSDRLPSDKPRHSGVAWFVAACFGSTGVIAAAVLIGGGRLGAIRPPLQQRIFLAEGRDSHTCDHSFEAPDSWELRWEHQGELQEICWTNAAGESDCFAAMHRKPIRHQGSVNVSRGGTLRIHVKGVGPWKIEAYALGAQGRE